MELVPGSLEPEKTAMNFAKQLRGGKTCQKNQMWKSLFRSCTLDRARGAWRKDETGPQPGRSLPCCVGGGVPSPCQGERALQQPPPPPPPELSFCPGHLASPSFPNVRLFFFSFESSFTILSKRIHMFIAKKSDNVEKFKEKCENHLRFRPPELTTYRFGEHPSRPLSVHEDAQTDSTRATPP